MRFLGWLFKHEEINGGDRCPTYLHRWTLFQPRRPRRLWRGFGIYLHKFVGDDWSRDLHDHPKRFISIGLRGRYFEWTPAAANPGMTCFDSRTREFLTVREYRAPWLRTFPAEHMHRLTLADDRRPCWTLVIVLWHVREWGFRTGGMWVHWRDYVRGVGGHADRAKSCD